MEYQIYVSGHANTGSGGARSVNHVYNFGNWVLWSDCLRNARVITATSYSDGNKVGIGQVANPVAKLHVRSVDGTPAFIAAGTTKGIRIATGSGGTSIQGVDHTGVASFQPLDVNGSILTLSTQGNERARVDARGRISCRHADQGTQFAAIDVPRSVVGGRDWPA